MKAVTREEKIMSGENLTPITRKEMFLAKAAGQNVETPEPATREEMFLSKISGGSGGVPINNQNKTITENGVYQADEGYTGLGTVTVEVASTGGGDIDALIDGSITEFTSNVESITGYVFYGKANIKRIDLPKCVTMGVGAIRDCAVLTDVNLPLVEKIKNYGISSNNALTKLRLPSVKNVDGYGISGNAALVCLDFSCAISLKSVALNNNKILASLLLRNENSISGMLSTDALSNTAIAKGSGYIYVPRALVDSYKTSSNWSNFGTQFRALEDYTVDGTITGELDESKI